LEPNLIQQLDETVAEVFNMMLGRACPPELDCCRLALSATCTSVEGDPIQPAPNSAANPHLTAHIVLSGCVTGACAVCLDLDSAAEVTEALIGMAPGELPDAERDSILADTVGELCNMIAGGWKMRQRGQGANCALSTPQITAQSGNPPPESGTGPNPSLRRCYRLTNTCLTLEFTVEE
jgi:chemotaxis protein CheX